MPAYADGVDSDANAIVVSFAVGLIGFGIFIYGKRQSRFPHLLVGILLMAYPYFVSNVPLSLGLAAALIVALWLAVRFGL